MTKETPGHLARLAAHQWGQAGSQGLETVGTAAEDDVASGLMEAQVNLSLSLALSPL